jgi:glycosyltransferase involved in cell wall biosynthesis
LTELPNESNMAELKGRPVRVAVCMPSRSDIKTKTFMCTLAMQGTTMTSGVDSALLNQESSMVSGARNDLVGRALDMGVDWILWVDSDMTFPRDALLRLLKRGKDIIGATYLKRVPPYDTLGAFVPVDGPAPTTGVTEAYFMPGGMMLVKAAVYRNLPYPWYFETIRSPGSPVESFLKHIRDHYLVAMPKAIEDSIRLSDDFSRWLYDEAHAYEDAHGGARHMSEDYNFCRKVRTAGHRIWCDLDLTMQMGHIGDHVVLGKAQTVADGLQMMGATNVAAA